MIATLSIFKTSPPFDLSSTLTLWDTTGTGHPVLKFRGKPKRRDDPTVEAWLKSVKEGCIARRVPKSHRPDIAKHFMSKKARSRVLDVEKVMRAVRGESWKWRWKDFKAAVRNMGCEYFSSPRVPRGLTFRTMEGLTRAMTIGNIADTETRVVSVERQPSSGFWRLGRNGQVHTSHISPPTASK